MANVVSERVLIAARFLRGAPVRLSKFYAKFTAFTEPGKINETGIFDDQKSRSVSVFYERRTIAGFEKFTTNTPTLIPKTFEL